MKKDTYTDEEILTGIQVQTRSILQFVYQINFRSVKYFVEKNGGTDKDAEDVFQDAMIHLYDKVRSGELQLKCSVHTYLFSVSRILWLGQLKKQEVRRTVTDEVDSFTSENDGILESLVNTERKALFIRHFNELTEDCQKIIKYFLKGFTISEITKKMGFSSEQHTKNRRFRCKKSLIERILQNPNYKELANGTVRENYQVPRW
jgi:RNA polymerase sigma factor, sigma-70 family